MLIRKDDQAAASIPADAPQQRGSEPQSPEQPLAAERPTPPASPTLRAPGVERDADLFDMGGFEGVTMADLLGPEPSRSRSQATSTGSKTSRGIDQPTTSTPKRSVDDFD